MNTAVELPCGTDSYRLSPRKVLCLGLNYRDHIQESVTVAARGDDTSDPPEPVIFNKLPSSLIGPNDAIRIPEVLSDYGFSNERTDYEGEIALVIGRGGKNIAIDEATDHILGVTAANDVSQRNIQKADRSGWLRGKSFDTFCPVGPRIVPTAEISNLLDLGVTTRLNGSPVQSGRSSHMIFSIPYIIHFISRNFVLEEGDLILTGTPAGVGPLAHGDVVEVEVEGIGVLSNPVLDPRVA